MKRITPDARALAEANGIDWEKGQGTGDGGAIVEQDVPDELARQLSKRTKSRVTQATVGVSVTGAPHPPSME